MVDLVVVIVNYNTKDLTLKCLETIYQYKSNLNIEIWLVDNGSSDSSINAVKNHFPKVKIIESQKNLGFAGGNNLALKRANAKYYLLLNSDTEVMADAIDELVNFAQKYDYDISSCQLVGKDGKFQPNAGQLPEFLPVLIWISGIDDLCRNIWLLPSYQETGISSYYNGKKVGWVSGSVMLIKKEVLKKIGYLDENIFMYGEDVEYCLRATRAGFRVGWTNQVEIVHLGGGSSKFPRYNQWRGEFKGLLYIYQKYYGFIAAWLLRLLFYIFISARAIAFLFLGKFSYTKTYAKIVFTI